MDLTESEISGISDYIAKWHDHLENHFGKRLPIKGKRILVIGSGWGTEVLWALKRGAAYVVGVDPSSRGDAPLLHNLKANGLEHLSDRFELRQCMVQDLKLESDAERFDYAISNNVFEHIFGLSAALAPLRTLLKPKGRTMIFTDPLYFSSYGSHLKMLEPWEHLSGSQAAIRDKIGENDWRRYREGLNGMTITDFLSAVRESGMAMLELYIVPDPRIKEFPEIWPTLPPGLKPMDLCLEGLCCVLAYPEHF